MGTAASNSMHNNKSLYRQMALYSILWVLVWCGVFYTIINSAINVWWTNDTFNHCFFVLPVAFYFIWKQRGAIFAASPSISLIGGMGTVGCMLAIMVGRAASIDVLQHVGVFALLPASLLFFLGFSVARHIWFPMFFMLFSIPIGEEFVPLLQNITADISLYFLKLINIPVFRDGLYIMVPNGNFVVAEACSGISFFIACSMIGFAYAYMNFLSPWKAILFACFSIVLPIITNGIRVFGIIYIADKTNMEYAVGADHLIYGGVFFAFIIALLLCAGYFSSDGQRAWHERIVNVNADWNGYFSKPRVSLVFLPMLLVSGGFFALDQAAEIRTFEWRASDGYQKSLSNVEPSVWRPQFENADAYFVEHDRQASANVFQALYQNNEAGKEMIFWSNRLYDIDAWSISGSYKHYVEGLGDLAIINLASASTKPRLLAYWYSGVGFVSDNKYEAKLSQSINALLFKPSGGALTAVSMSYSGSVDDALSAMKVLLDRSAVELQQSLNISGEE